MTINDPRDNPAYQVSGKGYKPQIDRTSTAMDAKAVEALHEKADTDAGNSSVHHTLGPRNGQASPGDHNHNGKNSRSLLKGTTITGSRAGGAALISVIDALEKLGATDATTA